MCSTIQNITNMKNKCPNCGSKDISDGESDFLLINGIEVLIQFCFKCHKEWQPQ